MARGPLIAIGAAAAVALALGLHVYPVTANEGSTFGLHMPLLDCFVGVLACVGLVALGRARANSRIVGFLASPVLRNTGLISYSIYLTHLPVLILINDAVVRNPNVFSGSRSIHEAILMAVGFPVVMLCAYAFYLTIERPFAIRKPTTARRSLARG